MSGRSPTIQDPLAFAVGLTLASVGIAALYLANTQNPRQRWRDNNTIRRLVAGDACRYPYVARDRDQLRSPSSVRYRFGKDGRRSLRGSAIDSSQNGFSGQIESESAIDCHRGQALSSSDILLHVLHFLDRGDTLVCSTVSTLFRETATDDTIWINYTKEYTARLLPCERVGPEFLLEAGLDRVMDMLYARLPKAYMEIYPHFPPTREVHASSASRVARKSWHRWWLTMAWVQEVQRVNQQTRAAKNERTYDLMIEQPTIVNKSFKAVDRFGSAFLFPEQIILFACYLYRACCEDYWEELENLAKRDTMPTRAPLWGDMLSVINGFLRLYRGRDFMVWKDNMGFLLEDPERATTLDPSNHLEDEDSSSVNLSSPTRRQLRIPCTHGLFLKTLANRVKQFEGWPYSRQITMEGLLSHLMA